MGVPLFDFAANIGKQVFKRGEPDAAKKLKEQIEKNNPGISDLQVEASAVAHPAAAEAEFVLVQDGDTLWGISERAYGNGARYTEIFAANREVIEDPDLIFPGQKIRIPS